MHKQNTKDENMNWLQNFCCLLFKKKRKSSSNPEMKKCDSCIKKKATTTRRDPKRSEKTGKFATNSQKSETAFHKNSVKQLTRKPHRRCLCRKKNVKRQKRKHYPAHPFFYPILRYFLFWCPCFCCCKGPRRKIRENCCANCIYKKNNLEKRSYSDQRLSASTKKTKNTKTLNKQSYKETKATAKSKTKTEKVTSPKQKKHGTVCECGKNVPTVKSSSSTSLLRKFKACSKRSRCQCLKQSLNVQFQRPPKHYNKLGFKFIRKRDLKPKYNGSEANSVCSQ